MTDATSAAERPAGWLTAALSPQSVAIVGASDSERSPGARILRALLKYKYCGRILAVNPRCSEVLGVPCYPSLTALPEIPDVAIVVVAAKHSVTVLTECAKVGITNVIVGSSGYSETGPEGAAVQDRLTEIAREHSMVLIGPNTNGVISVRTAFTGTFTPALAQDSFELKDGPLAVVSQSGAIGASLFYLGQRDGLGIGTLVNTGNEISVSAEHAIKAIVEDDAHTTAVLAYAEGLRHPGALIQAAHAAEQRGKIIGLLKVGNTPAGARATAAHTANMAGEDRVYTGILRQLGIVRADSVNELVDVGRVLAAYGPGVGRRLSVASMSGGLGIMLTDLATSSGLHMAAWTASEQAKFDGELPDYLSRANPIDVAGAPFFDLDLLERVLKIMDSNPGSDVSVLAVCNFEKLQEMIAARVIAVAPVLRKPIFVVWLGGEDAVRRLNVAGVPAFSDARACIRAIALVANRRPGSLATAARAPARSALASEELATALADPSGNTLLSAFGVNLPRTSVVDDVQAAAAAANRLRFPLVAKLMSPQVLHKSDVGGVLLGLTDLKAVESAVTTLLTRSAELGIHDSRVILQEQAPAGLELIVGMKRDPTFGLVVTIGLGGVLAEAFDDVAIRLPVLDEADIADALGGLSHQKLLSGFRGLPMAAPSVLAPLIMAFSRLVREVGERFEAIEINPVLLPGDGSAPIAVDVLLVPLGGAV